MNKTSRSLVQTTNRIGIGTLKLFILKFIQIPYIFLFMDMALYSISIMLPSLQVSALIYEAMIFIKHIILRMKISKYVTFLFCCIAGICHSSKSLLHRISLFSIFYFIQVINLSQYIKNNSVHIRYQNS